MYLPIISISNANQNKIINSTMQSPYIPQVLLCHYNNRLEIQCSRLSPLVKIVEQNQQEATASQHVHPSPDLLHFLLNEAMTGSYLTTLIYCIHPGGWSGPLGPLTPTYNQDELVKVQ